jgi:hypothetical protein
MKLARVDVREFADSLTNDLNLDIDLNETFTERVDLDKTGIDSAIKSTELGDQTDVTLRDRFVGIRTANAAGEGSKSSNARAQRVDCARCQLCDSARGYRVVLLTHASVPASVCA